MYCNTLFFIIVSIDSGIILVGYVLYNGEFDDILHSLDTLDCNNEEI
jgi:hypothetical protein